jgi:ankyrin repeat protein
MIPLERVNDIFNSITISERENKLKKLLENYNIDEEITFLYKNILFYVADIYCYSQEVQTTENIILVLNNGADVNYKDKEGNNVLLRCLKQHE